MGSLSTRDFSDVSTHRLKFYILAELLFTLTVNTVNSLKTKHFKILKSLLVSNIEKKYTFKAIISNLKMFGN